MNLKNTLANVCQALAGEKGIKIVWEGPPRTDGKTIYSFPLPLTADEDTTTMIRGDLDHECAHVIYSDFAFFHQKASKVTATQKGIWNAIEDTFIEKELASKYLGCKETLADSVHIAIQKGMVRKGDRGPGDSLGTFVDAWGRLNVLGQKTGEILDSARGYLGEFLSDQQIADLEKILEKEFHKVDSTKKSFELSKKVMAFLKNESQSQSQSQDQDQNQGEGENQSQDQSQDQSQGEGENQSQDQSQDQSQGEGESQSQDQSQGQNQGEGENQSQDQSQDQSQGEGENQSQDQSQDQSQGEGESQSQDQSQGQNQGEGENQSQDQSQDQSQGEGENQSQDQSQDQSQGEGENQSQGQDQGQDQGQGDSQARNAAGAGKLINDFQSYDSAFDRRRAFQLETEKANKFFPIRVQKPFSKSGHYDLYLDEVRSFVLKLERDLRQQLLSKRKKEVLSDQGRLDSRRAVRALTGDSAVYRSQSKKIDLNTAVTLCIDMSGSMQMFQTKAKQTLCLFAESVSRIGLPFEVSSFSTGMALIKEFGGNFGIKEKQGIAGLNAGGSTNTGPALIAAGNRIAVRKEKRKIIFLITDGTADDPWLAKECADIVQNSGIELYGIGLGLREDIINTITNNYVMVSNMDELPNQLAAMLSSALTKNA